MDEIELSFTHILFLKCIHDWEEDKSRSRHHPLTTWIVDQFNAYVTQYNLTRSRCHVINSNRKVTAITNNLRDWGMLRDDIRMGNTHKFRYALTDFGAETVEKVCKKDIFSWPIKLIIQKKGDKFKIKNKTYPVTIK